ncbi:hypothetical protein [Dethiosulfovibrio marinus]|nr:hypothetical protein [Dethiosulfovibrio marinus]MCF4146141.1 hypothetical protein [Dethiosulfovibrio acidaminovorans]
MGLIFISLFFLGWRVNKNSLVYLFSQVCSICLSLIPLLVNQSKDIVMSKSLVGAFLYSAAICLLIEHKNIAIGKKEAIRIVFWGAFLQIIIGVYSFIFMEVRSKIFALEFISERAMSKTELMRLIGLGAVKYAGAGIYFGVVALIAMGVLIQKGRPFMAWATSLFFILAGSFFSRTTLVSVPLLFVIFILSNKNKITATIKAIDFLIVLILFALVLHNIFKEEPLYQWGLEPVYNLIEHQELRSNSTDGLKTMYSFPDKTRTYIFGDGKFVSRDVTGRDSGYYMHTDVGYLRLLYYGGVPMIIVYFIPCMVATVLYMKSRPQKTEKYVFLSLIAFILVVNLKGLASANFVTDIFLFSSFKRNNP